MLGLDVACCSGCIGETSSIPSPDSLPMMAEVCPVRTGQRAFCCGHHGNPLTGYLVSGGLSFQQRPASSEGGRPRMSRELSCSDSSQSGESRSSGGVAQAWSA